MSSNTMDEVSLKEILQKYNLIIPEIQREYVWGKNEHSIIDTFINDIKENYQTAQASQSEVINLRESLINLKMSEEAIKAAIETSHPQKSSNIGFVYSYKPDYYVYNDENFDVYLIDGQQRITTLFLFLFYFALKENRMDEFKRIFRFDPQVEKIAFDYRVRTLTHNFIFELIRKVSTLAGLTDVKNQNWFLKNYQDDTTIKSIVGYDDKVNSIEGVFAILQRTFNDDDNSYFDYLLNRIKFWHFKTEETSQGEELYITMNSRGQQLSDNESIRAKLFGSDEAKKKPLYWAEQWEIWQDFFWKNRGEQINADFGIDEFLRWVSILNSLEESNDTFAEMVRFRSGSTLNGDVLSLQKIKECFDSIVFLYNDLNIESIKKEYSTYSEYNLLNKEWLCANNKSKLEQIELFRFLPIIQYCNLYRSKHKINPEGHNVFRVIRFFYNLKDNETIFKTSAEQILPALRIITKIVTDNADITNVLPLSGNYKSILTDEELSKLEFYKSKERIYWENIIWTAESYSKNRGSIKHLLDSAKQLNILGIGNYDSFQHFFNLYKLVVESESLIWGNLLDTDVYSTSYDRVTHEDNWYKKSGVLNIVSQLFIKKIDLEDLLLLEQKNFINLYENIEMLKAEENPKKQLYILYILQKQIFENWNWQGENYWNFGISKNSAGVWNSIFDNQTIFQFFNIHYTYSFERILAISIQKKDDETDQYLYQLLSWAKN